MSSVLIDLGSTFSYVFVKFAIGWDLDCEYLDAFMHKFTLVGVFVSVDKVYHECLVMFIWFITLENLDILDMKKFNVILGIG